MNNQNKKKKIKEYKLPTSEPRLNNIWVDELEYFPEAQEIDKEERKRGEITKYITDNEGKIDQVIFPIRKLKEFRKWFYLAVSDERP